MLMSRQMGLPRKNALKGKVLPEHTCSLCHWPVPMCKSSFLDQCISDSKKEGQRGGGWGLGGRNESYQWNIKTFISGWIFTNLVLRFDQCFNLLLTRDPVNHHCSYLKQSKHAISWFICSWYKKCWVIYYKTHLGQSLKPQNVGGTSPGQTVPCQGQLSCYRKHWQPCL